jgi:2-polyprenyl-3-methyl-5-hydroxy-6-metoxy-1,4-benzoquinol methylase
MEMTKTTQREYNPAHPNFERWQKARDLSDDRAKIVEAVISNEVDLEGLKILDIGAGEGSTSKLLSKKNKVTSLEPKRERINKIAQTDSLQPIIADSLKLPFSSSKFDLIILQDVIEHLNITRDFVDKLKGILIQDGLIYLSTPNRISILNIISDPHWGMPFLCLFKREQIKKYFLKYFRKSDYDRDDIAELLSLKDIKTLFGKDFSINLFTKFSLAYLLDGGKGLIWSKLHLSLVSFLKFTRLTKFINGVANDEPGIINKFFTPTFYIILKKI